MTQPLDIDPDAGAYINGMPVRDEAARIPAEGDSLVFLRPAGEMGSGILTDHNAVLTRSEQDAA